MLGGNILLVVLLGQVAGEPANCSDLVARLGAGVTPSVRPPPMRWRNLAPRPWQPSGPRSSPDQEIRNRAGGLVQKIEGALLTQPTRVRLDFERAPLTDVVRSLDAQTGFKITLYPETLPKWKYAKVTLHEPEPVPFWKAIDLLSAAALIEPNPRMHGMIGAREPTFALTDGPTRAPTPNYDHGPFRVSLRAALSARRQLCGAAGPRSAGFRAAQGGPPTRPSVPTRPGSENRAGAVSIR